MHSDLYITYSEYIIGVGCWWFFTHSFESFANEGQGRSVGCIFSSFLQLSNKKLAWPENVSTAESPPVLLCPKEDTDCSQILLQPFVVFEKFLHFPFQEHPPFASFKGSHISTGTLCPSGGLRITHYHFSSSEFAWVLIMCFTIWLGGGGLFLLASLSLCSDLLSSLIESIFSQKGFSGDKRSPEACWWAPFCCFLSQRLGSKALEGEEDQASAGPISSAFWRVWTLSIARAILLGRRSVQAILLDR